MSSLWPALDLSAWSATCDTLHAHTQILGKLAVALAPPEPQLQHAALRLTARGWETAPLPAPTARARWSSRSTCARTRPSWSTATDARSASHSPPTGRSATSRATCWTRRGRRAGRSTRRRRRSPWTVPLDEDDEHATLRPGTGHRRTSPRRPGAALVLAAFRAPYRGRSTPVNAWWGSFDLAVSLFSGRSAEPPSNDFIMRNSMDAQEIAVGWWPGDARYPHAAFFAYAFPAPDGFAAATLSPAAARWDSALGEYLLDWDDVRVAADPHATALEFARSAFRHACTVCDWDAALAASAEGQPPPVS